MPLTTSRYDVHELEGLPAPVQRYFRAVLKDGQSIIAAATVEHTRTFNLNPAGEQWKAFTSTQRVFTRRPGFVWNARIAMAPGLAVYVHDLAQGEFVRFFAESAWYPTGLLPSQGVHWDAVDEHSAKATLVDG
ncbi:MAG: DUF6544 family protein, partial [Rhodoferax sp.]